MATKKSMWVFIILLVSWTCLMGIFTPASAETLNYKLYSHVIKSEPVPIDDVVGHNLNVFVRKGFYVFENGEVAIYKVVGSGDFIGWAGPFTNYITLNFADGSTIIIKAQGGGGGGTAGSKSEIIKGTGRFEGIKGTGTTRTRYLPMGKDEIGPTGIGEGSLTYTLPPK